jgi:hypothetical protein
MKKNLLLIVTVLIAASLLGACAPSNQFAPNMTVTGIGQVQMTPDVAYIYVGVHTEGETASSAVTANTTNTQKVIDALTAFGVEAKDIRTSNFSIWPMDQYNPETGEKTGTKYAVDNSVYVTVRDISKMGDMLDGVIKAGANSINSIQFDVADKTQALADARKAAVASAQKQAEELAAAAGVKLGKIQNISYYDSVPMPYYDAMGKGGGAMDMAATVPVSPGQLSLTVNVTITYELK